MKVTIHKNDGEPVTLKIEGKIAGPYVTELRRAWQDLTPSLGSQKLAVDLRGVTHIDALGKRVLAEIHSQTGAAFLADTPLTRYFAEQAQQGPETNPKWCG